MKETTQLLPCGHRFCNDCWSHWFTVGIEQKKFVKTGFGTYSIKCPAEGCENSPSDVHFIKQFVNKELYESFKQSASLNFSVLGLQAITCPSNRCNAVMVPPEERRFTHPYVKCIDCQTRICLKCRQEFLPGHDCTKPKLTSSQSSNSNGDLIVNNVTIKRCPNPACPMIIEKQDDTCNYMRCTFCKHEFCWVCLKHWPSDVYLGGMKLLPLHMLNYRKPCDCPQRTQSGHIANAS